MSQPWMIHPAGPLHAGVELSARPRAAAMARHTVHEVLRRWEIRTEVIEDAELVTSELVSNAQRYGGAYVALTVFLAGKELTVAVQDSSTDVPQVLRGVDPMDERGRGLPMVATVAAAWGVRELDGGKQVWARLAA